MLSGLICINRSKCEHMTASGALFCMPFQDNVNYQICNGGVSKGINGSKNIMLEYKTMEYRILYVTECELIAVQ